MLEQQFIPKYGKPKQKQHKRHLRIMHH